MLLLYHPRVAELPCRVCQRYVYQFDRHAFLLRGGQPVERPPQVPPPCGKCPKGGPQHERAVTLSRKNMATLRLYQASRATSGAILTAAERRDPIVMRNLAALDAIYRVWEREQVMPGG